MTQAEYERLYDLCYQALGTPEEARVGPPLPVKIRLLRKRAERAEKRIALAIELIRGSEGGPKRIYGGIAREFMTRLVQLLEDPI